MKLFGLTFVALAAFCACAVNAEIQVEGAQGLRIKATSDEQLAYVASFDHKQGFDFLSLHRVVDAPIDVLVAQENLEEFKANLDAKNIEYEIFAHDVGKVIDEELRLNQRARMSRNGNTLLKTFPKYTEITAYLDEIAAKYSDFVSTFSIGKSYEGREIIGVKFSKGGSGKQALFIDAGIHAREWIAPTTALYAIKELAENPKNSELFENIDIYIIPCLNPDGYEYTHQSRSTRLWRKTRSINKGTTCRGVDPNRNFGREWMTVGASDYPCDETYAGSKAFSEPETAALRDFLLGLEGLKVYLSFHSYGNYFLHPWGFTSALPKNEPTLRCVAERAEAELSAVRGTRYKIGSSTNVLYAASGGSDDWAMADAGAELAYTIELPGGYYGFAPPPSHILPVGRESFEAIKIFAKYTNGEKVCQARKQSSWSEWPFFSRFFN